MQLVATDVTCSVVCVCWTRVSHTKTANLLQVAILFWGDTQLCRPKEPCVRWGCTLVNMIERSVYGCNAALCRISLNILLTLVIWVDEKLCWLVAAYPASINAFEALPLISSIWYFYVDDLLIITTNWACWMKQTVVGRVAFFPLHIGDHVIVEENTIVNAAQVGSYVHIGKNCVIVSRELLLYCWIHVVIVVIFQLVTSKDLTSLHKPSHRVDYIHTTTEIPPAVGVS